eukprot:TRINITY_DN12272_c0_g3_i1.p1 TRINITY_DN12272_c0_g3~~TRINITY_DN12272_c0_g3_i1.p1  ORF type:complete len:806 (+),score=230.55 TRINITY_DN12272_c0_g3_i1:109-2526(+)
MFCCAAPPRPPPIQLKPLKCTQVTNTSLALEWALAGASSSVHGVDLRVRPQKTLKWMSVQCRLTAVVFLAIDADTKTLMPRSRSEAANTAGGVVLECLDENCEYEVKACIVTHANERGPFTPTLTCKTLTSAALEMPTLNVEEVAADSALVSWGPQPVNAMMKFRIRKVGAGQWVDLPVRGGSPQRTRTPTKPNVQRVEPICTTEVDVPSLTPETDYEIMATVVSYDPFVAAHETAPVSFSTLAPGRAATRLTRLTTASVGQTSCTLKWNHIPNRWFLGIRARRKGGDEAEDDASPYLMFDRYRGKLVAECESWAPDSKEEIVEVGGLDSGCLYGFSARTLGQDGVWSPWGEELDVVTQIVMPPLLIGKMTNSTVHFEWEELKHAINVAVRVRKGGEKGWKHLNSKNHSLVALGDGIAPRAQDGAACLLGLEADCTYEAASSARTKSGWGPYGAKVTFQTLPKVIVEAACVASSSTSIALQLNLPANRSELQGLDHPVSVRCRVEGEDDWNEVGEDGDALVPVGKGAKFVDGQLQVNNLKPDTTYHITTSRNTPIESPLVVTLGSANSSFSRQESGAMSCATFRRCREALAARLSDSPILLDDLLEDFDKCFCPGCHTGADVYQRGNENYIIPRGWCKAAVRTNKAKPLEKRAFESWCTGYHGTSSQHLSSILASGQLLKPGSTTPRGGKIPVRDGHIQKAFERKNTHVGKTEFFDPRQYIFFSPSMLYCDYGCAYMTEFPYKGRKYRFAIQVRIQPNTFSVGPETVGAKRRGHIIDPNVSNHSIEWYTAEDHTHMITGVLVCER